MGWWWAYENLKDQPDKWSFCTYEGKAALEESRDKSTRMGIPLWYHGPEQETREPKPGRLEYRCDEPMKAVPDIRVTSNLNLYSFFAATRPGHCACDIPKHQCRYHR